MKKWAIIVPVGAAAIGAVAMLAGKSKNSAPKAAKPAGKKAAAPVIKTPKTDTYSFASGFKDAKTVEVSLTYDAEKCSYNEVSEAFLVPTADTHAGIIYGEDFAMQVEYAPSYAGDDFAALTKDVGERCREAGEITCNGITGIKYFNGKNFCMAFPIEGAAADYVLINVVNMGDDTEEEAAKLPDNEMVKAIMNSLTIVAK